MRLLSYNILDGGVGRADPLAEIIAAQDADIVALIESTDLAVIERIANRLKMDFIHAPGVPQASALLSRFTIRDSINHALLRPGLTKSFLEATIVDPAGQPWSIAVADLLAEAAKSELDLLASRRPHILCGGFPPQAVLKLQEIGYRDTLGPNAPATYPAQFPSQRPDRIFVWNIDAARIPRAWIETDRLATYASDHYPVGAGII